MTQRFSSRLPPERKTIIIFRALSCRRFFSLCVVVAGSVFFPTLPVFSFFEIARGEIILNTTGQVTYDSNIFARNDAEGDLYFSLIPELQFLRHAGRGTIDARAGVDITRFIDFSDEDYEDLHATLDVTYPVTPGSPLAGEAFAGVTERSEVNDYLNTRVKQTETGIGTDSFYQFSERLALRNNLAFEDTDVEGFSGTQTYGGSLGLQWIYSEKLSFFSDYRLEWDKSDGEDTLQGREVDNTNHSILFGAIGVLRPRITGTASVGYQQTNSRSDEPDTGLIITAIALNWAWRPKTDLILEASRELEVSPTDETVERSDLTLGLEHDVDEKISLTGKAGFRLLDFRSSDRQDNALLAGAGIRYIFTRYWNAGADYDFTYNASTIDEIDYTRQLIRLFTRYSF